MKLIIASWNRAKVKKIQQFFQQGPIEIASLSNEIADIEETALTFIGNAQLKVEAVKTHFPDDIILGEDSGLTVDSLDGFPGVKTARFFPGDDADRAVQLMKKLTDVPLSKRTAQFNSSIAIRFPNGESASSHGTMHGWIKIKDDAYIQGYGDIFLLSSGQTLADHDIHNICPFNHHQLALFQAKQHILEYLARHSS